jgi:pheromone shutdown protein TraB
MVNRLISLNENYEKIITCIGDGHVPGISKLLKLKKIEFETIRLSELRNQENKDVDSTSGHFSINYSDYK